MGDDGYGDTYDGGWAASSIALQYLADEDLPAASRYMEEADAVAGDDGAGGDAGRLAAVTFASLGAYHRRAGDLEAALAMLQQALAVQDPVAQPTTAAATHLNLGATLLSLSDHRGALEQAQAAVILLQTDLFNGVNLPQQRATQVLPCPRATRATQRHLAEGRCDQVGARQLADGLGLSGNDVSSVSAVVTWRRRSGNTWRRR